MNTSNTATSGPAGDDKREERPGADRPFRIGTRGSPLALAQAEMLSKALRSAHGWRSDQVELVTITSTGDRVQDRALAEIGGKALWTKELDAALAAGETDCSVHSMKDVETHRPDEFVIAANLERGDPRDRLVGATEFADIPDNAVVGTASPRRKAQLLFRRDDLDIRLIRGNVETRLEKLKSGEYDVTLLAAAGLDRLGMDDTGHALSIEEMCPAPAQAVIGVETLTDAQLVRRLLHAVSHSDTFRTVTAERSFLKALKADCHSPVGAHAWIEGGKVHMRAQILLPDGSESVLESSSFDSGEVDAPQHLARKMLGKASEELRAVFGT